MKWRILGVFLLISLFFIAQVVLGNAMAPPSFRIQVSQGPQDLKMAIGDPAEGKAFSRLIKKVKAWDTSFYYYGNVADYSNPELRLETEGQEYFISLPSKEPLAYEEIYELNFSTKEIKRVDHRPRSLLYAFMRLVITLVAEALILWVMGFRHRHSYLVFLLVNLITQGFLNFVVLKSAITGYWQMGFFLLEIFIFLFEAILLPAFICERSKPYTLLASLVANLTSLLLGAWILTNLPI